MANVKYTRLVNEINANNVYLRWVKSKIPIAFLKQQVFLLAIIFSSLVLLIVTTFFTLDADYELAPDADSRYGVIVDCGSSGTRAHIFRWTNSHRIELLRDTHKKPLNKHITPGLSTLRDRPNDASDYMEPIMDFITASIPYERHLTSPVHFLATAGMRLLEDSDQKKILSDIIRDLRVKYDFPQIRTKVITGQYEGAYSWMSVNLERFYESDKVHPRSIGIVEMGGASLQVTYELDNETERMVLDNLKDTEVAEVFKRQVIQLDLPRNKSVRLFATSFLGLGVNKAREYAVDFLLRDYLNGTGQLGETHTADLKGAEIELFDPCLNNGSTEVVFRPLEVAADMRKSLGFALKDQNDAIKVKLQGSGNFLNCLTMLERVVKTIRLEELSCTGRECPMKLLGTNFIPFRKRSFVGLSEMFFTTNEIMSLAGPFNRSRVLHATSEICGTKYSLLQLKSKGIVSYEDRVLYECFKATWLLTILHNSALKMPGDYNGFSTIDRLGDQEIDWTMGAMFWETLMHSNEF